MKRLGHVLIGILLAVALSASVSAQTGVGATSRLISGGTLPATCVVGAVYEKTGTAAGLYVCLTTNTWTISGIQFADLTSPPPGTALGTLFGAAYTDLAMNGVFQQHSTLSASGYVHSVENNISDAASGIGIVGYQMYVATGSGNANNQSLIKGADIVAEHDGSGDIDAVIGADFDAESFSSGTVTQLIGSRSLAHQFGDGTITELSGYKSVWGSYGSGGSLVAQAAAFLAEEDSSGTPGPITTNYGLKIPTLAQGVTNIAISVGANPSIFGGSITATDFIVSGSAFKTDTTNGHQGFFQAYDVDGAAYKTFATLTNANTPTFDISAPAGGTLSGDFTTLKVGGVNVLTGSGVVTSIAGTSNQITASASTGAVTLSIPTNPVFSGTALTFPGALSIASGKTLTASNTLTFTGTDSSSVAFGAGGTVLYSGGAVTSIATSSPISGGTITGTGTISLLVNTDFNWTAGQTITAPAGSKALTLAGGTQTTSQPALDIAQTWNASGTVFTGARMNITRTAAATGSTAFDFQLGGTSEFQVRLRGAGDTQLITPSSSSTLSLGGTPNLDIQSSGSTRVRWTNTEAEFNSTYRIGWSASGAGFANDAFFIYGGAAATIQMGADVNGAAVNQTIQAANGITGTDKTGGNITVRPGAGTGAGGISSFIVQSPTLGTTGTTAQTQATRLTIDQTSVRATVPVTGTYTQNTTIYSAAGTALPTCNAGAKGATATVSDATAPTFRATYTSGGAVIAWVFCDGTNWIH